MAMNDQMGRVRLPTTATIYSSPEDVIARKKAQAQQGQPPGPMATTAQPAGPNLTQPPPGQANDASFSPLPQAQIPSPEPPRVWTQPKPAPDTRRPVKAPQGLGSIPGMGLPSTANLPTTAAGLGLNPALTALPPTGTYTSSGLPQAPTTPGVWSTTQQGRPARTREEAQSGWVPQIGEGLWSQLGEGRPAPTQTTYNVNGQLVDGGMYLGPMSRELTPLARIMAHAEASARRAQITQQNAATQAAATAVQAASSPAANAAGAVAQAQAALQQQPPQQGQTPPPNTASASQGQSGIGSGYNPLTAAESSPSPPPSADPAASAATAAATAQAAQPPSRTIDSDQVGHGRRTQVAAGSVPVQTPDGYVGMSAERVASVLRERFHYSANDAQRVAGLLSNGEWAVDLDTGSVYEMWPNDNGGWDVGDAWEEFNLRTSPNEWSETISDNNVRGSVERGFASYDEAQAAKATAGGGQASQPTETPEQKADRLAQEMLGFQAGQRDAGKISDSVVQENIDAGRRQRALEEGRAMWAAMEQAAAGDVPLEARLGAQADIANRSAVQGSQQEAQLRLEQERQNVAADLQWISQRLSLLGQVMQMNLSRENRDAATAAAKELLQMQTDAQRRMFRMQQAAQPSAGEQFLGGLVNFLSGGLARAVPSFNYEFGGGS